MLHWGERRIGGIGEGGCQLLGYNKDTGQIKSSTEYELLTTNY